MRRAWKALVVVCMMSILGGADFGEFAPKAVGAGENRWSLDFWRMHHWPEPFVTQDRCCVRAHFAVMKHKGWKLQNTLTNWHFDSETNHLNPAGVLKVRSIVTEGPMNRRTLFVLRAPTPEHTLTRIDSVQRTVAKVLPHGPMPMVTYTDVAPRGWPADYIEAFGRKYQASIPEPRLPAASTEE